MLVMVLVAMVSLFVRVSAIPVLFVVIRGPGTDACTGSTT
jgi:hypothetical protein